MLCFRFVENSVPHFSQLYLMGQLEYMCLSLVDAALNLLPHPAPLVHSKGKTSGFLEVCDHLFLKVFHELLVSITGVVVQKFQGRNLLSHVSFLENWSATIASGF